MLARARRELKDVAAYSDLGPYLHEGSGLLVHSALPAGVAGVAGIGGLLGGPLAALAALGVATAAATHGDTQARNAAIDRTEWLAKQRTGAPSVTVATPGLSNHGVGQAIDFQVHKRGGAKLAGASNPDHWRTSGWADASPTPCDLARISAARCACPTSPGIGRSTRRREGASRHIGAVSSLPLEPDSVS